MIATITLPQERSQPQPEGPPRAWPADSLAAGLLGPVLDEFAHGVVILAAQRRVVYANPVARVELGRARVLCLVHDAGAARLQPCRPRALPGFEAALAAAASGERRLVTVDGDAAALQMVALPVPRGMIDEGEARPPVALCFARAAVGESASLALFARHHRLTPTEEQVLAILCEGYSTPEIATRMGVAVSTVRNHVRNLCVKTRAFGLRELVHQVAVLPPVGPTARQLQLH